MSVNDKKTRNLQVVDSNGSPAEVSLVDTVYQRILLGIIRGEYVGGQELKSTLLAKELGVSRTPVVQALQRLASDGIVTLEMNKRAVVRAGAENWLVEIHQLRELLEPHAASLAAARIPDETFRTLDELVARAADRHAPDWTEAVEQFDFALHLAIADNTENLALREAIRKCWSFKRLSYAAGPERPETLAKAYQEHLAILTALKARDAQTAAAAMLFHLRSAATMRPERGIV